MDSLSDGFARTQYNRRTYVLFILKNVSTGRALTNYSVFRNSHLRLGKRSVNIDNLHIKDT